MRSDRLMLPLCNTKESDETSALYLTTSPKPANLQYYMGVHL